MPKQGKKLTRAEKIAQAVEQEAAVEEATQVVKALEDLAEADPISQDEAESLVATALPDFDAEDQIAQAWNAMLTMATAQGATRGDILLMTLTTAGAILGMTGQAMWPEGSDLPLEEAPAFGLFQALVHGANDAKARILGDQG